MRADARRRGNREFKTHGWKKRKGAKGSPKGKAKAKGRAKAKKKPKKDNKEKEESKKEEEKKPKRQLGVRCKHLTYALRPTYVRLQNHHAQLEVRVPVR